MALTITLLVGLGCLLNTYSPSTTDGSTALVAEKSSGTWARAFREAVGVRREAIDLLFRCNIVSLQEFTSDEVQNERVEEWCWLAVNMLAQQTVSDWAGSPEHARETFEQCLKASFPDSAAETERQRKRAVQRILQDPSDSADQGQQLLLPGEAGEPRKQMLLPALVMPDVATPWEGAQTPAGNASQPLTIGESSMGLSIAHDWQSSAASDTERSCSPGKVVRYLNAQPRPTHGSQGISSRAGISSRMLGPAPNVFKYTQTTQSPDFRSPTSPKVSSMRAVGDGRLGLEGIQEKEFRKSAVPVVDCSPRSAPTHEADLFPGWINVRSIDHLTRTPIPSTTDVQE